MLSGMAGRDPGPENLPGMLLHAFWGSLEATPGPARHPIASTATNAPKSSAHELLNSG
jgi:hypothetical protein